MSQAADARVVVVGAGAAGLAVAETLRLQGHTGELTLVGAEAHPPYDRPPLSKQILAGEWTRERLPLRAPERLAELGLSLRLGETAVSLDPVRRTVGLAPTGVKGGPVAGEAPYDVLVVATGVRARALPGAGARVLRTVGDAVRLRERLVRGAGGRAGRWVVVGAGFLGAEAASVVRTAGAQVTVLEPAPVPLEHAVGRRVGEAIAQAHRERGVDVRTGVAVASVAEGGVLLADGESVEADEVLVAVGSVPNTEWLGGSGLTLRDGLVCDAYCRAAPGVFGAGDVARWHNRLYGVDMRLEHRTNASEQGMAVARNVLSPRAPTAFAPVPYFWSDQFDLRIQAYGYLRGHDAVALVEGEVGERRFVAAYRAGGHLAGVLAMGMAPRALRPWRRLVAERAPWAACVPLDAPVLG